ncbi:MAG: (2Fe-2S) ferredoxin domain-containing protein [Spirochaetaceae bacterium]|nr:MAG: (2Fe-2S) ferredoxin domain-containing protein [Spirochaetaceae bacterium]
MTTVTVCVGSSCHIKGSRQIIVRFNELLKEHGLEDKIELQGSFCMERCGEGLNWQIDEEPVTSNSVEEAILTFIEKVVQPSTDSAASKRSKAADHGGE